MMTPLNLIQRKKVSENQWEFSEFQSFDFFRGGILTEIKWIFTDSQRHSLIQSQRENITGKELQLLNIGPSIIWAKKYKLIRTLLS